MSFKHFSILLVPMIAFGSCTDSALLNGSSAPDYEEMRSKYENLDSGKPDLDMTRALDTMDLELESAEALDVLFPTRVTTLDPFVKSQIHIVILRLFIPVIDQNPELRKVETSLRATFFFEMANGEKSSREIASVRGISIQNCSVLDAHTSDFSLCKQLTVEPSDSKGRDILVGSFSTSTHIFQIRAERTAATSKEEANKSPWEHGVIEARERMAPAQAPYQVLGRFRGFDSPG